MSTRLRRGFGACPSGSAGRARSKGPFPTSTVLGPCADLCAARSALWTAPRRCSGSDDGGLTPLSYARRQAGLRRNVGTPLIVSLSYLDPSAELGLFRNNGIFTTKPRSHEERSKGTCRTLCRL